MADTEIRKPWRIADDVAITLDIGGQLVLKIPVNENGSGSGNFPEKDSAIFKGKTYTLTQGFGISEPTVGKLEATDNKDCIEIKYTHLQPAGQTICFFGIDGRVSRVNIIRVLIHDHTSIYQGGPAHGTYYSESDLQGDDT